MASLSSAAADPWPLTLPDEDATTRLGAALFAAIDAERAGIARSGLVIALSGGLGAGKTTLVRALLRAAGVSGPIKSPTFAVLEPYVVSRLDFYHFDFYRFNSAAEFDDIGFREYFGPHKVCLVEWPERVAGRVPTADLHLALVVDGATQRRLTLTSSSDLGTRCLTRIRSTIDAAAPRPAGGGG